MLKLEPSVWAISPRRFWKTKCSIGAARERTKALPDYERHRSRWAGDQDPGLVHWLRICQVAKVIEPVELPGHAIELGEGYSRITKERRG